MRLVEAMLVEADQPKTGLEVACTLGQDASGNVLPLGWASLGASPVRTSLALCEDPSIFALILVHPFVYLACLPPERRAAWVEAAAGGMPTAHFAPFHGTEKLVAAAYEPYAAPLALPPPVALPSQPTTSGKYVPPHKKTPQ